MDLDPRYRRCRYQSHIVIFTVNEDEVVVVRILHARMDIHAALD
jgi:plasmid stabilization system protein ParE